MMKKILLAGMILSALVSCGNNDTSSTNKKTDSTNTTSSTGSTDDPEAKKGLALIAKSDCLTCHKLNEASTGPAYALVAAKYRGNPASVDSLANKIIKGGSGNWGSIPMPGHAQLSKEDALTMVHYVLSIK